nr:murein transglycosylase domain-containing protein [Pseudoalteromonas shioyasakiensis]
MNRCVLLIFVLLVNGCKTVPDLNAPIEDLDKLVKQVKTNPSDIIAIHKQAKKTQRSIELQVDNVNKLLGDLELVVNGVWGKQNSQEPSRKKYVKYSNDYQARAIIDFDKNTVQVETIATKHIKTLLTQAIVMTLLTSSDPDKTDIFTSEAPSLGDEPFLYQQVLDQDGLPIKYHWRANRFAQYLVNTNLQKKHSYGHLITSVTFPLVAQNLHLRKQKYSDYVLASAKKYQISAALIYSIIETESSFNPYAVSSSNAYGLMQIIPATAGKDVYQRIKKVSGQPTKTVLFDPKNNIDIGTAYLSILKNNYLNKIWADTNKHYAMISSYNGGAGNVLRIFNSNRTIAFSEINNLTASEFYLILTTKHSRAESRRYLEKVIMAEKKYQP